MKKHNETYYITLRDIVDINTEGLNTMDLYGYGNVVDYLIGVLPDEYYTTIHATPPFSLDDVNNFINKYFFPLYRNNVAIVLTSLPANRGKMLEILREWGMDFVAKIKETYERYTTLISCYLEKKGDLLTKIATTSESRVNDTPQNGGAFEDDTYTSLYNKQNVLSDRDTPMERLAQIDRDFKNLYKDWARDLSDLFFLSEIEDPSWEEIDNGGFYD